jgi:acyl transferase domain-containing protein
MSAATAVAFAVAQGEVFAESCPPGSMLAVLNPRPGLADENLPDGCELALRGPKQLVITGEEKAVSELAEQLSADGTSCVRMPVRTGFHSAALDAAAQRCLASPMNQRALPLTLPMASCSTGSVLTGSLGAGHLWRSVRGPIRFAEALAALVCGHDTVLIDLGPGGSLAGLAQNTGDQGVGTILGCHSVLTPLAAGRARIPELLARLG